MSRKARAPRGARRPSPAPAAPPAPATPPAGPAPRGQASGIGIVVSGGAPSLHLAAGALCAFHKRQVRFDVIGTAGAGALPALLYAAPRDRTPEEALRSVVNLNVHDAIYRRLPANYKVFFKYGPFSSLFWQLGQLIPHFDLPPAQRYHNSVQRLYNDLVDLVVNALTPTTLRYSSKSVLTRVEVVNSLVDWDALRSYPGEFYLNAFNLRSGTLELFDKRTLDHEAFYAALALPWLYSPTQVRNVLYTEGAAHDPSALEALLRHDQPGRAAPGTKDLESIVVLDTIGPDLWTDPEDTYEALQLTIMDPIVTLAENVSAFYALQEWIWNTLQVPQPKIYRLRFDVPSWERGRMLQWGYENALTLWDIGYESAQKFCDALLAQPVAAPPPVEQYRYLSAVLTPNSRVEDFLGVFGVKAPGPAPPPGGP